MGAYTPEELARIHTMRQQERDDYDRKKQEWNTTVHVGYCETETEYSIQFRLDYEPAWYAADPFYEPLRTDPGHTHSEAEAHEVAGQLLAGTRGVTKQDTPGDRNITAVQVTEVVSTLKVISRVYR